MATVYLGLGANLGDREGQLRRALDALNRRGDVADCSSVYETLPWGVEHQPLFLNLCCRLETRLDPMALHGACRSIERRLGRAPGPRWGPRTIDIDLLAYDEVQLETARLSLPHPRIAERAFVLAPLAEIAPELRLPGLPGTVATLLAALPDADAQVRVVGPAPAPMRRAAS